MTGSNNSLENIYLAKVPKSHVVAGCETAQGAEDAAMCACMLYFLRCENDSDSQMEMMNCKMESAIKIGKNDIQVTSRPSLKISFDDCIFWF